MALAPRKDAWSKASLVQSGRISVVDCNGSEVQRTRLTCSLQSFVAATEARVARLLEGTPPQGRVREACQLQALLRVSRRLLSCGHMRVVEAVELYHCTNVQLMDDRGLSGEMRLTPCHRLRMQLLVLLPVMKLPFRFTGCRRVRVPSSSFRMCPVCLTVTYLSTSPLCSSCCATMTTEP